MSIRASPGKSKNVSFTYRFERFFNYHVTNTTELFFCNFTELLVCQVVAKPFYNILFKWQLFCLKCHQYKIVVFW